MLPEVSVTILYGTQTGNSEDVAERVNRLLKCMQLRCKVSSLADYPITNIMAEKFIIFICSTTGDGNCPDDMLSFWKFLLRKALPIHLLKHLDFCVFGLGDSSYEKFNVVAKRLNKRLLQLSANEFLPLCLADDQHELGYNAALDPWISLLKETLIPKFDIQHSCLPDTFLLPPKFKVQFIDQNVTSMNVNNSKRASVKSNKRVTAADHFQSVHWIQFEVDASVTYMPGDVAVVMPENSTEEIDEFLSLLNVPLDTKFHLIPTNLDIQLPKIIPYPCTVRECVSTYFDITSVPRRVFFEFFKHFSKDETEKEKLEEFTTAEGQEELYSYCNRPKRSVLEIMQDFPFTTPNVPFEYLFDMIPPIRARSFSIASSLSAHPKEFHLIVAVVEYRTRLRKPRKGLCSNWLSKLPVGCSIPFSIRKGSISLPKTNSEIIMVGPGTGCAPFRSFIEERAAKNINGNYLFFGCRYEAKDFLFQETWKDLCERNYLNIYTAFSRDYEDKVYVQHKIAENKKLVRDLICNKGAHVFVAGNSKQMPTSVKEAFIEAVGFENADAEFGKICIQELEKKGRYQVETWS